MLLKIKNVLDAQRLQEVQELLATGEFVDGRFSAGMEAAKVKNNQELSLNSPLHRRLNAMVMGPLVQHPEYQAAVLPLRVATAFYARYTPGMTYGFHVDDPVMGPMSGRYRTDVSTTVFLNDDYEGGEIVIRTSYGEEKIRGKAGDAIVYDSGSWHKVAEVTAGTRLVAVTWAQSLVKDPYQRELLYQLGKAREGVMEKLPQSDEASAISTVHINLLRMWSNV
ncbi:Fe2+-dependent dioxygenase [Thiothrix nivea]|uniref:PKHD-type hydroxylase ybiX n=1 Tax=Thiothrix nivea (strain ATCC 35100 / DSM 5205 / JP2) TaxID=870187 RepID=A0A656HGW4_THINJ|nr:Fe2+-dependent dioxygenase [Thiothrix nivea]EIJ36261.1 PKHD-type hydroxylase ybiX [Thiothrix nivea DSM 5205]